MKKRRLRSLLAVALTALLFLPAPGALAAGEKSAVVIPDTGLTEEQKIVHLLNRLGYGPRPSYALRASEGRPSDIERVKRMGIAAYIEQQLNPDSIPDEDIEQRLAGFKTLKMTPFQLLAAYPPPQLLRGIEQRLAPEMGMDPDAAGSMFPELERYRELEQRREQQAGESAAKKEDDDPVTRELRRQEQMSPEERMQQAMASPARIVLELSQAKLLRAVYSERQLEEVMTDFWFNHFNVFIGKGADRWLTTSYEQEAIRPRALGKFRDLLGATASHPAMLFYLDNWLSADPKADYDERALRQRYAGTLREQGTYPGALLVEIFRQRGMDPIQAQRYIARQLDRMNEPPGSRLAQRRSAGRAERAPDGQPRRPAPAQPPRRGLNENYARELLELHTLGVDGGYTQQDIIEVARCFTGWTLLPLQFGPRFLYVDQFHDRGAKRVLGQEIKNGGRQDGERVLDLVARHPATARFISTKLARRFVSDAPPASLVDKMAATFRETDGDIRAVLRTLFSSEEFWSPGAVNAKVKTPLEFVASAARATGAEVDDLPPGLVLALRGLGQPLYSAQPPTGYKDTADAWVSTGALLNRMKVAMGLAANRLPGVRVEPPAEALRVESTRQLVTQLGQQLLGQELSESTRAALEAELAKATPALEAGGRQAQARLALGWLLASPEFQRR